MYLSSLRAYDDLLIEVRPRKAENTVYRKARSRSEHVVFLSAAVLIGLLLLVGCGSSSLTQPIRSDQLSTAASVPLQPEVVLASRIPAGRYRQWSVKPGTVVSKGLRSTRAFADPQHGITLAQIGNVTFPAATTDGGRKWRVDGPVLFADTTDGPLAVGDLGTAGPRTYFAYGGGGSVVDVTIDAGKTWWSAFLGEEVLAVVAASDGKLVAVVQEQTPSVSESLRSVTWLYASTDGGRRWRATNRLGG